MNIIAEIVGALAAAIREATAGETDPVAATRRILEARVGELIGSDRSGELLVGAHREAAEALEREFGPRP